MSETERIELLKAVADCAPEWMGAELNVDPFIEECDGETWVSFRKMDFCPSMNLTHGDLNDADAIIAMLDVMEKEGFIAAVYPDFKVPQGEPLKYYVKLKRYSDGITVLATIHGGETRAEAVSRAFVAVFGGKE